MSEEAFIYEAIRTPRGKQKNGSLHEVKPLSLVVGLIDELRKRHPDLDENLISDVILGCVSPVGDQGGDIARAAVLASGMPVTSGGVQLNRFCASGLEAVNTAAQKVRSGWDDLVLAGGVESMSRVPMGSDGGAMGLDFSTTDANASLSSNRSMSSTVSPARSSTLRVAGVGPVSMITGSAPLVAVATMRARGVRPCNLPAAAERNARRALITLCIGGGMGVATIIERV